MIDNAKTKHTMNPHTLNFYSLSSLLDLLLFLRVLPILYNSIKILLLKHLFLTKLGWILFSFYILHPLVILTIPVLAYGFYSRKKWAFWLYYAQLPFRYSFVLLSFGFLFYLESFISIGFYPLFYFAVGLEIVRLLVTIREHVRGKRNSG